jgi:hypothetical protein
MDPSKQTNPGADNPFSQGVRAGTRIQIHPMIQDLEDLFLDLPIAKVLGE